MVLLHHLIKEVSCGTSSISFHFQALMWEIFSVGILAPKSIIFFFRSLFFFFYFLILFFVWNTIQTSNWHSDQWYPLKWTVKAAGQKLKYSATLWAASRISNLFLALISAQGQCSLQWEPRLCHTLATGHQQLSAAPKPRDGRSPRPQWSCQTNKLHQALPAVLLYPWNWLQECKWGKLQSCRDTLKEEYRTWYWSQIFDAGTSCCIVSSFLKFTEILNVMQFAGRQCAQDRLVVQCIFILPINKEALATVQNFNVLVTKAPVDAEVVMLRGRHNGPRVVDTEKDDVVFLIGRRQKVLPSIT